MYHKVVKTSLSVGSYIEKTYKKVVFELVQLLSFEPTFHTILSNVHETMWSTCNKLHEGLPCCIEEVSSRCRRPTFCCFMNVADWMKWVTTSLVYFIMLRRVLDVVG